MSDNLIVHRCYDKDGYRSTIYADGHVELSSHDWSEFTPAHVENFTDVRYVGASVKCLCGKVFGEPEKPEETK